MVYMAHDRNHRRPRYSFGCSALFASCGFGDFLCGLLLKADYACLRTEETRHFAGQLSVQCLVDGRKHALCQQPCDQILRADFQLLSQIFNADALGDSDAARNRQRLVR